MYENVQNEIRRTGLDHESCAYKRASFVLPMQFSPTTKRRGHDSLASPALRLRRDKRSRSDREALAMVDHVVRTRPTVLRLGYLNHQQIAERDIQPALGAVVARQSLAAFLQGRGIRTHLSCLSHRITPSQRTRRRAAPRMLPAAIIRETGGMSKTDDRQWTKDEGSWSFVHSSFVSYPTCGRVASDLARSDSLSAESCNWPLRYAS